MRMLFLLPVMALSPVSLWGNDDASPEVAAIGMLPKQRTAQRIAPSERNPFAVKPKELTKASPEETETQESKIRAIFKSIPGSGVRRGSDGRLVALVGDLILREGEEVKPVLADQTELLMVSKIDSKKVELTFVENKDATQPRTIPLLINNQPRVAQKLFAQAKGGREMYYPSMRAAAAGVATVLNVVAGSGAALLTQNALLAGNEVPSREAASGIGVITAPTPAAPSAATSERNSFAALVPGGTGTPFPRATAEATQPPGNSETKASAEHLSVSASPLVPVAAEQKAAAPPSPSPAAPTLASPGRSAGLLPPSDKMHRESAAATSPLRMAVPPPPAQSRPLIE
ncbi:MAG: hypothetical protein ACR2OZ_07360 [Verrucomicrobiales bacterium]